MKTWIDRLLLLGLAVIILASVAAAYPVFSGHHVSGTLLMAHMMASGTACSSTTRILIEATPKATR